ncbi:MAG: cyclic nucleotide-binding domain-containing protein [Anaerolineales bacterium]|nr:cyclic nucleotide-binding domain-containing protein [Anaerolineales bacterium]
MDGRKMDEYRMAFLASSELFSSFDRQVVEKTSGLVMPVSIRAGEYLFRQGETRNSGLYLVVDGELQVSICDDADEKIIVGKIGPRESVGEIQLLTGQARTADVMAVEDTQLLFLSKPDFDQLASETPQILNLLGAVIRQRQQRNRLFKILPNYFGDLDLTQMEAIEAEIEWVHLQRGQFLMRYQAPSDDFCILINGRVQVSIPDQDGKEQIVSDRLAGENVGEMGFFTGEPRSANIYALRDTDAVRFSKESFYAIQCQLPQSTFQFTKQIITRLHRTMIEKTSSMSLCLALVPLSPNIPLADFANRLTELISQYIHTLHFSSASVDDELQQTGISQTPRDDLNEIRLVTWLDEKEKRHAGMSSIYEVDSAPSNWTSRCIQRADRVIFIGKAGSGFDAEFLRAMMPDYHDGTIHKELVLLYDESDSQPMNTEHWLDQIGDIRRHYHIRTDHDTDYQRMARILAGKAIGLVLGGGGARGFAHIGVLRAIEEAGLNVDLIGGNSIGSIIAAAFALGMDWQEIGELTKNGLRDKKLLDYTFPAVSLISGKSLITLLKGLFGSQKIEDTWIEYFCVSANLTRARQVVHQRGLLWKYVRASSALSPFFPPVTDDGDLLVDGVLVNNLPLDVMRKLCPDCTIIGVDVSSESALPEGYDFDPGLSGWPAFWRKLNPLRDRQAQPHLPGIMNLIMRINEFSSVRQKHRQYDITNYIIRPDVEGVNIFQFDDFDRLIELGYQAGQKALAEWQDQL